jgi:hypothetical protein
MTVRLAMRNRPGFGVIFAGLGTMAIEPSGPAVGCDAGTAGSISVVARRAAATDMRWASFSYFTMV